MRPPPFPTSLYIAFREGSPQPSAHFGSPETVAAPGPGPGGGGRPWRGARAGAGGGGNRGGGDGVQPASRAPLSRSRSFEPDPRDPGYPRDVRGPSYPREGRDPAYRDNRDPSSPRDTRDPSYQRDARDPSYPRSARCPSYPRDARDPNYPRDSNRGTSYHRDMGDPSYLRDPHDSRDPYAVGDRSPRDNRDHELNSRQRAGGGGGGGGMPLYRQGYPSVYSQGYPVSYPVGYPPGYPSRYAVPPPILDDSDDGPSRCATFWHYVWKLSSCLCSHITLVSLVIAYCILGAVTFEQLEKTNEIEVKKNISHRRSNVTEWLWVLTNNAPVLHQENWTLSAIDRLHEFEKELLWAMRTQGWDGSEDTTQLQWTFSGALFYSIIVITTIGYGHIAPKTQIGKVVTIFYAILGIPLMLLCLSNIGDVMAQSFRFLYWRVCCYVCTRPPQPPPPRRARFTRSARPSTRSSSRVAPFRRSGRVSTRSADGALGGSQAVVRSSHSDTEARYPDEEIMGPPRYAAASGGAGAGAAVLSPPGPGPVLFNKYALDREESGRARDGQRRLRAQSVGRDREGRRRGPPISHGGSLPRHHRLNEFGSPRNRDQLKNSQRSSGYGSTYGQQHATAKVPSPRIMSPMGFGLHRQYLRAEDSIDFLAYEGGDWYSIDGMAGAGAGVGSSAGGRVGTNRLRPVPIWLCVFLVISYIFGGAFLFSRWESWPFLDSAYFCFITLTTIGFGDFVPAQRVKKEEAEVSIALCSLYLLFGIALLAMSFNLVQEEVLSSVRSVARRLGIIKAEHEED